MADAEDLAVQLEEQVITTQEQQQKQGGSKGKGKGKGKSAAGGGGAGAGGDSANGDKKREKQISMALSRLLRHQALNAGIKLDKEGYAPLEKVVSLSHFSLL